MPKIVEIECIDVAARHAGASHAGSYLIRGPTPLADPASRVKKLIDDGPIFRLLKKSHPEKLERLVAVEVRRLKNLPMQPPFTPRRTHPVMAASDTPAPRQSVMH